MSTADPDENGRGDHVVLWWLAILTVLVGIAFGVTYQRVNHTVQENRALIVQLQETNQRIITTGNATIINGCKARNAQRQGTLDFLDTFGDSSRAALLDPHASADAKARATQTLVSVKESQANYTRKNKPEVCKGPLHP